MSGAHQGSGARTGFGETELRSPASHILETALALRRSPGERFRLLAQPLPSGIVHVLELAAGAPAALGEASADLGESEGVVLEAARFYLEQMLFAAPDADAYRVLGVAHDAPGDAIRLHHRLLQRWLHPDRAVAGDATVFATRVNQAWSQLRTPALRHGYDVMLAEARMAGIGTPLPATTFRHWEDVVGTSPKHGRRSRWLFAAALASCAVLAVLIVRHEDDVGQVAWEGANSDTDAAMAQPSAGEGSDIDPLSRALAMPPPGETPANPPAREPRQSAPVVTARPPEPQPVVLRREATTRIASPESPGSSVRVEAQSASVASHAQRSTPPTLLASGTAGSFGGSDLRLARVATQAAPPPAVVVATSPLPRPPAPIAVAVPEAVATIAPVAMTPSPDEIDPALLMERMNKARQRVAQVAAYLSATPGAAPLWNDVRTQADADRVRQQLAFRPGETFRFDAPNWQLRPDNASFSGAYRCSRCGVKEGRLEVRMVWREGLWLVRGVVLGPAA